MKLFSYFWYIQCIKNREPLYDYKTPFVCFVIKNKINPI